MRRLILGGAILSAILAAGCDGQTHAATRSTTSVPSPPPTWLSQVACGFATGMHDPSPSSAVYVQASHDKAEQAASGALVHDDTPVYLLVLTGDFIAEHSAPPGAPNTTRGHFVTISVARDTQRVLDWGIQDAVPDLSGLGTSGMLPTTCGQASPRP
jgi:hypothetical protein